MDDAFAQIESASESDDYASIAAEYDPELGYPTRYTSHAPLTSSTAAIAWSSAA